MERKYSLRFGQLEQRLLGQILHTMIAFNHLSIGCLNKDGNMWISNRVETIRDQH